MSAYPFFNGSGPKIRQCTPAQPPLERCGPRIVASHAHFAKAVSSRLQLRWDGWCPVGTGSHHPPGSAASPSDI